jgi:hypothetical protein
MNNINKSLSINETYIIDSSEWNDIFSACTALYTNNIISCSGNTQINLGDNLIVFNGNTLVTIISATTYYGDGSNLTGISTQDTFVTGGTYSNGAAEFTNNTGGTFTVSGFYTGTTTPFDVFVTGGTYSNGVATFTNNTGNTFSVTGFTTPFTGGTVSAITATTISATTYLGLPIDIRVTGATKSDNIAVFTNNTGGTFTLTGLTDTFITGITINNSNYDLTLYRNDGVNLSTNLGILSTDVKITGGTYDINTGVVTFTNNTGGTFNVTGFTSGMTDSYTTGTYLDGNIIKFNNNIYGENFYNVNLTPILSGKTDNFIFNEHTGNTNNPHQTSFSNLISTAHTHNISDVNGLNNILNGKIDISGGTITGNLNVNSLSATTYYGLPLDIFVTGGTYSNGTLIYKNNTGGTFSVTGITDSYTTGATLNGNIIEFGNNLIGPNYYSVNLTPLISGFSKTDVRVTGGTYSNGTTVFINNTGGTFSVTGFTTPFTGGTVSGTTFFTGGLSATTISATTYLGLPIPTLQQVLDNNHDLNNGVFNAGTGAGDGNVGTSQNALGEGAGADNQADSQNAMGYGAGRNNTGESQNAMGYYAGENNTASHQNAFGEGAGANNQGGGQNAFGFSAGGNNIGEGQNAMGSSAGVNNQAGNQNTFGDNSGQNNTGENQNAFGARAGQENTGENQNALGGKAGYRNSGTNVNALGFEAGVDNTFNNVNLFGQNATAEEDGSTVLSKDGTIMARISTRDLTDSQRYKLQDKSGTLAHLDDIPTNTSQLVNDGEDGTSPFVTADQLPSNLNLFATNVSSDIATYFKLVTSIDDPDYNTTPVNIPTGAITTTGQFIAALSSEAGVLIGNPGIINLLTIGNVRRVSGSGTAEFYYEVYHRTSGGTETLISTSSKTPPVSTNVYTEFLAAALLNNGTFLSTDRIVVKYYADRIGSGSDPSYNFQFGGTSPVRTTFPVPASNLPFSLDTLTDVVISGATGGDILAYNDTTDLWENKSIPTVLGYTPLPTAAAVTTGVTISFVTDRVYGTLVTPETGDITADVTGGQLGVTNIIIHNSGTAPTFSSEFKKLSGSGNYVVNVVNYIYCTFITSTEIIYSINQRT